MLSVNCGSDKCHQDSIVEMTLEDSGIDSDPKPQQACEDEKAFIASSDSSASSTTASTPKKSNTAELQRKLEKKIAAARKNHASQTEYKKCANTNLIPIQRLPVPSKTQACTSKERQPLVEWDTDESEEEINFFPISQLKDTRQELRDTFSIENLELSEDEDDLNLVPPRPISQRWSCCPMVSIKSPCTIM